MSLPAFQQPETASRTGNQPGLDRAARLMRMLGPAAAGVWNELSAGETANLRQAMTAGPIQPRAGDAAELRRRVTSPKGTTERAVQLFQEGGFEDLFLTAMTGARDRSVELAEELGKAD